MNSTQMVPVTYDPAKRGGAVRDAGDSTTGFIIMVEFGTGANAIDVPIGVDLVNGLNSLHFKLGKQDEGIDLGTVATFYANAVAMFPFLPPIDFNSMPEPIKGLVQTHVKIMNFEIDTGTGLLLLDVKLVPENPIKLPLFDMVAIKYAEFMLDRPGSSMTFVRT